MPYRLGALVVIALSLLGLAGCVAPPPDHPVRAYFPNEILEGDQFDSTVSIKGGTVVIDYPDGHEEAFFLRTIVEKQTKLFQHQLYIEVAWIGGAAGFDMASDDTAHPLRLHRIDRSSRFCRRADCSRYEQLAVDLDDAFLRARAAQGFRIKIASRRKGYSIIFSVDPAMIRAQLAAADNFRRTGKVLSAQAIAAIAAKRAAQGLGISIIDFPIAGVLIRHVDPGSLAENAGFVRGDLIKTFDGKPVESTRMFQDLVNQTPPGRVVHIGVERHYEMRVLTVQM